MSQEGNKPFCTIGGECIGNVPTFETQSLVKVLIDDYVGDDDNDRILDLKDDYDNVRIFMKEDKSITYDHLCTAYAIRDVYGIYAQDGSGGNTEHYSQSFADPFFQGKMVGADKNKVKLGKLGNQDKGTNYLNFNYVIIAVKYGSVQTL